MGMLASDMGGTVVTAGLGYIRAVDTNQTAEQQGYTDTLCGLLGGRT